jgi:hypothetical protein
MSSVPLPCRGGGAWTAWSLESSLGVEVAWIQGSLVSDDIRVELFRCCFVT